MFTDADLVFAYTPTDALADGTYVDARREPFATVTHEHLGPAGPVYLTRGVNAMIEAAVEGGADAAGVWHDVLWMALRGGAAPERARRFTVKIGNAWRRLMIAAPGRAYVTVYLPEED